MIAGCIVHEAHNRCNSQQQLSEQQWWTREREVHTQPLCFRNFRLWVLQHRPASGRAANTRYTPHTRPLSIREWAQQGTLGSKLQESVTRMHTHTRGALLYDILMLHVCRVLKTEWFHRKVRTAQSQREEDILSPSHCHWWTLLVNPNIKGKIQYSYYT